MEFYRHKKTVRSNAFYKFMIIDKEPTLRAKPKPLTATLPHRLCCFLDVDNFTHLYHNPIFNSSLILKNTPNLTIGQTTDGNNNTESKTETDNQNGELVETEN